MNKVLHNSLAHARPWEQSPRKLISLWDMIEFLGYDFIHHLLELDHEGAEASQKVKQ